MRDAFHEDLDKISDELVTMTKMASAALDNASKALLTANRTLAESVIAGDDDIDAMRQDIDNISVDLLARQQPVATDLRMVVTAMYMSSSIERMGDLARHIAKVARMSAPNVAIPAELADIFTEMSTVAVRIADLTAKALADKDVYAADSISKADDELDELHRKIFALLLDEKWTHGMEAGINATLLSRYYERFGDHAVSVGSRIVYLVTGHYGTPDAGLAL